MDAGFVFWVIMLGIQSCALSSTDQASPMLSPKIMMFLARVTLTLGFVSLIVASFRLFHRAIAGGMPTWNLYWLVPVCLVFGYLKAVKVMRKKMRQNIVRLKTAKGGLYPWDIYPRALFAFILSMILIMIILKQVFTGHPNGLAFLGCVDLTVAVALLVSSLEYR